MPGLYRYVCDNCWPEIDCVITEQNMMHKPKERFIPRSELNKQLKLENKLLRDGLQYVMSEKNPLGFATDAQVACQFLQKADDVTSPPNDPN